MSNLLVVRDLTKSFPGQVALDNFDIEIGTGRTHALVGQNGSGKSTFIKILAGFHQPDPGSVADLAGHTLHLGNGDEAAAAGVRFVHQDLPGAGTNGFYHQDEVFQVQAKRLPMSKFHFLK